MRSVITEEQQIHQETYSIEDGPDNTRSER